MGHVAAGRSLAKTGEQATLPDHITHGTRGLYGLGPRKPPFT